MAQDGGRTAKPSDSTNSTDSRPFYSARSSLEDTKMQDVTVDSISVPPTIFKTSSKPPTQTEDKEVSVSPPSLHTVDGKSSSDTTLPTSPNGPDTRHPTQAELLRQIWISPPNIPLHAVKYGIGRRELAMQTQHNKPFDLVHPEPYVRPPFHTPQTEKLKAWHKLVTLHPLGLPRRREVHWSQVKIAFGPLGWDQVWGYLYVDLEKIINNAGYVDWWLRAAVPQLLWCCMYDQVEAYGAELAYPYGYDARVPMTDNTQKEDIVAIPADQHVLVPLGKAVYEWARQVHFRNQHWDNGPPFLQPFNPHDRMQEPPTITLRFRNIHPELSVPLITTSMEEKGGWRKGWLTTDELTILSGEADGKYLDTILNGGPKYFAQYTRGENRSRMLRFWGIDEMRDDVIRWMFSQEWLKEKVWARDEEDFRSIVEDRVGESVIRAIRNTPV